MSGSKRPTPAQDERNKYAYASGAANTVINSLAKVCIAVTAAGVIGIFSSTIQVRSDVAVISEKVGKLEQRTALTTSDLSLALQPVQQTIGQHTADLAESKKQTESLDRRIGMIESNLDNIRRDIGTITDVLKNGAGHEQIRRR